MGGRAQPSLNRPWRWRWRTEFLSFSHRCNQECYRCELSASCSTHPLHSHDQPLKTNPVQRGTLTLYPDHTRGLLRPFLLANGARARKICAQFMALAEREVRALWQQVRAEFGERHARTIESLERRFEQARPWLGTDEPVSKERKWLLGAYSSHEFSLEAAALFNPSLVPHPDQSQLSPGSLRFILSLRATGEGHISSITFRTGGLDAHGAVTITPADPGLPEPAQAPNASYEKSVFERKLREMGSAPALGAVLRALAEDSGRMESYPNLSRFSQSGGWPRGRVRPRPRVCVLPNSEVRVKLASQSKRPGGRLDSRAVIRWRAGGITAAREPVPSCRRHQPEA